MSDLEIPGTARIALNRVITIAAGDGSWGNAAGADAAIAEIAAPVVAAELRSLASAMEAGIRSEWLHESGDPTAAMLRTCLETLRERADQLAEVAS